MNEPVLLVDVRRNEDGSFDILAPAVGLWSRHPHAGALLGPGAPAGVLAHLHCRFALVLPDGVAGRLASSPPADRVVPVEFGQTLFRLAPLAAVDAALATSEAGRLGHPAGLPGGAWAVQAPTDGVFYARPSPGAKPFVEVGGRVRRGDAVGLVEVMKTFNRIVFDGPGFPDEAEVLEVRVPEAGEVRAGDVLIVAR